ncbi:hypothetical protein F0562_020593 [Nyssa sinensis]|uniref:BURP domain-containing protein n=1 Tax=Nyssa sinensis TaxID=561372 RepID=A0A5J5BTF6_9ASTE|nr:hypothetical protein F0562_020593 [Nyssa sinensis]
MNADSFRAREISGEHWNHVNREVYDLQHHVMDDHDHLQIFAKHGEDDGQKGMHAKHVHDGDRQRMKKHGHDYPSSHMDHHMDFCTKYLLHSQLPDILEFFSFSKDSPQAKAMEDTLRHCEIEPIKGENKFCATSLESMLDFTHGIFGLDSQFKVLTTTHLTNLTAHLQNYTILEVHKEISAPKMVACHTRPYPYAVFYCHCQESENKLFKVLLGSGNGDRVEAVAVCHMDTSQWDRGHASFRVLGVKPGSCPVCHFFPADNLIWVPSSALI